MDFIDYLILQHLKEQERLKTIRDQRKIYRNIVSKRGRLDEEKVAKNGKITSV